MPRGVRMRSLTTKTMNLKYRDYGLSSGRPWRCFRNGMRLREGYITRCGGIGFPLWDAAAHCVNAVAPHERGHHHVRISVIFIIVTYQGWISMQYLNEHEKRVGITDGMDHVISGAQEGGLPTS
jgi:hypothetical protein